MKMNSYFKTPQKYYALEVIDDLMRQYYEIGGDCITINEGVLGYGTVVCTAKGYKTAIIQERYLTPNSSGHTIRFYNQTPKKYIDLVDKVLDNY